MNLSYEVTYDELKEMFGKFGEVDRVEIPLRKGGGGQPLGIAYVTFKETEGAISCFATLDKTYFQGRKLHIMPAKAKPLPSEEEQKAKQEREERWRETRDKERAEGKSSYQDDKEKTLKVNFDDETNWNYLFLNQDTVAFGMARKLGLEKGQLMDRYDGGNMAVKMSMAETIIIQQTKEWLANNGVDLAELEKLKRAQVKRSKTTLLIKNIPFSTKEKDLRDIFARYGTLSRFLLSPMNTIGIVEYESVSQAATALKYLAYYKVNFIMPIYLEFAPDGFISEQAVAEQDEAAQEVLAAEGSDSRQSTVFVKNLNFKTTEVQLEELFSQGLKDVNNKGKIVSVKVVRKTDDSQASRGFGFVEFDSVTAAENAVKRLQNAILDDHALKLSLAQRSGSLAKAEA